MEDKPFKMKNPSLAKAMKEDSPMQLNYGKPLTEQEKKDFARKEQGKLKREKIVKKVKDVAIEGTKRSFDPFGIAEKGYNYLVFIIFFSTAPSSYMKNNSWLVFIFAGLPSISVIIIKLAKRFGIGPTQVPSQ